MGVELVGNYAVRIEFDDLHTTGIYTWKYLRELAEELNPAVYAPRIQTGNHLIELTNGETFNYLEWRPQSTPQGPKATELSTIICLHGFNQTAHSWDEFGARAAEQRYRVLGLDQRGHGDSYLVGQQDGRFGADDMV
jgi:predicted alpha/beta-fold hydrolase